MKITLNPTVPARAKLHMEAAWVSIRTREPAEVYTFRDFSVGVYFDDQGNIETRETQRGKVD